jgi:hypothetical protein
MIRNLLIDALALVGIFAMVFCNLVLRDTSLTTPALAYSFRAWAAIFGRFTL